MKLRVWLIISAFDRILLSNLISVLSDDISLMKSLETVSPIFLSKKL